MKPTYPVLVMNETSCDLEKTFGEFSEAVVWASENATRDKSYLVYQAVRRIYVKSETVTEIIGTTETNGERRGSE